MRHLERAASMVPRSFRNAARMPWRKYVQLGIVVGVFSTAVLIRHLREPAKQPFRGSAATSSTFSDTTPTSLPSPQTPTLQSSVPREKNLHGQQQTALLPVASTPTATPTPGNLPSAKASEAIVASSPIPKPEPAKWPRLFEGSVFADGVFTARSDRMSYGWVEITVTMRGGQIRDVSIVEFPNRTPTSVNMSGKILPGLISEAVERQDWDVDIVSGATQTAVAFQRAVIYALRASERASSPEKPSSPVVADE